MANSVNLGSAHSQSNNAIMDQDFDAEEAERVSEIARLAEERAAKRFKPLQAQTTNPNKAPKDTEKIVYRSKKEREEQALRRIQERRLQVCNIHSLSLLPSQAPLH